jgi:hypothetical protein
MDAMKTNNKSHAWVARPMGMDLGIQGRIGMKNRVWSLLLSVSVWVPMLAIGAQAQYVVKVMKVNVPFEFHVQGRQYPAGSYQVRKEGAFLFLRDHDGRPLTVLSSITLRNETSAPASKLVFFQYNGLHLLTQILWEGDKTGEELIRKGREAEVAQQIVPTQVEKVAVNKP